MDDTTKPVTGDWNEAARKCEQIWDRKPNDVGNVPGHSIEESMERTEEGYGSGKEGVDPRTDKAGRTPASPAG